MCRGLLRKGRHLSGRRGSSCCVKKEIPKGDKHEHEGPALHDICIASALF